MQERSELSVQALGLEDTERRRGVQAQQGYM